MLKLSLQTCYLSLGFVFCAISLPASGARHPLVMLQPRESIFETLFISLSYSRAVDVFFVLIPLRRVDLGKEVIDVRQRVMIENVL